IVFCTFSKRSRTLLASHPFRNEEPVKSATLWHAEHEAVNTVCPRAAWSSVYTPSHTDFSDCAAALQPQTTAHASTSPILGFISWQSAQREASNAKSWDWSRR